MNAILLVITALFALGDAVTYSGNWTSTMNNTAGTMKIVVTNPGPSPTCDFSFTIADSAPVKGETIACKIDAEKIQWEYKWELQGYKMRTKLQGTLQNGAAADSYETFTRRCEIR